jgi:solute carrier family 25 aspartate/glutamate transporter 12/13
MATVTEQIKESLVGVTAEPQLSEGARKEFLQHAHQAEDGEHYMTEQEFINAIAPASEDYVC